MGGVHALADLIHRRARLVLALTAVFVVFAAVIGGQVVGSLTNAGYSDPHSPSRTAETQFSLATGRSSEPDVEALVSSAGSVRGAGARALVGRAVVAMRAEPSIVAVRSELDRGSVGLVSRDGHHTLVMGYFASRSLGGRDDAAARRVQRRLAGAGASVLVGGSQLTYSQIDDELASDLPRIEIVAFSILLVLSLVAFRGLVAALLPLFVGAVAVAGSLLVMRALTLVTTLSVYSLNLVTGLGLGLAIDYSLFVVFRYREELRRRGHCADALKVTLATAGRTVCFSSLTVTLALLSLLVFPQRVLSSMGIAAAVVTTLAALAALIPLGALLAVLGPRVNALAPARVQRSRERAELAATQGGWYRLAKWVMRHAAPVAVGCAVLLLVIGLPARHINLGSTDSRALPPGASARIVDETLARDFAVQADSPDVVVVRAPASAGPVLARYAGRLARLPGAALVQAPAALSPGLWQIDVLTGATSLSRPAQALIGAIHSTPAPYPAAVAGSAASQYEQHASIDSHLVLALILLGFTTVIALFLMTGSVVLPVKSLIMNLLTLSGAFGILVFIFQEGRLQGLLGYTATGSLEQTNMIVLFIIAFGLSTDYGVFLLARIKEAHDGGASNREAVAVGLERSGRVVSAAAVLFCAAVGSLAASNLAFLKEFGAGAALAVLIDATVVRALLVPALMAMLGPLNWWAPAPLRRLVYRTWAHGPAPAAER